MGDEGVGRRYAVHQLAREMFCAGTRENTCECFHCLQLMAGTHPDFTLVTPEAEGKEIKVDQVREVLNISSTYPAMNPLRLVLIDGADRMNTAAANAILKTLEEPPSTVRFFLLSQSSERVIPTIRSRCGYVRFRSLPESFVVSRVSKSEADPTKALVYARMAEGSVGRAVAYQGAGRLSLRDKVCSLVGAAVRKDLPAVFSIASSLEKDLPLGLRFLEQLIHDTLMARFSPHRLIHIDLAENLRQMAGGASAAAWRRLSVGVRRLNTMGPAARINLLFNVQTLFVEAFFGV